MRDPIRNILISIYICILLGSATPAIQQPIPIGLGAVGWGFRVSVKAL
eukprot:COSAG01_NODE_4586_length_4894_cov_6.028989_5_plen_48_part_00